MPEPLDLAGRPDMLRHLLGVPEAPTYETPWGRGRALSMLAIREAVRGRLDVYAADVYATLVNGGNTPEDAQRIVRHMTGENDEGDGHAR